MLINLRSMFQKAAIQVIFEKNRISSLRINANSFYRWLPARKRSWTAFFRLYFQGYVPFSIDIQYNFITQIRKPRLTEKFIIREERFLCQKCVSLWY